MDPISVVSAAASIVGLLGAADQVIESFIKFIRSIRGAPKLAQTVLLEVSDVRAALGQLQRYLLGPKARSRCHKDLLMVDQLVVTLSSCVMVFSELEQISDSLKPSYPMQPGRLTHWVFKEERVRNLLSRLQSSKMSLNLMVTTLTCATVGEAQASVGQLTTLVRQLLETNQDMSRRMARMEMRTAGYSPTAASTMLKAARNKSPVDGHRETGRHDDNYLDMKQTQSDLEGAGVDNAKPTFRFTFDQDLNSSRPYARAMRRSAIWSLRSSVVGSVGWSCLSGLSIADISEISVVNLPISSEELWNGQRYSDAYYALDRVIAGTSEEGLRNRSESQQGCGSPERSESRQASVPRTRSESRIGPISRLGSISPTSNRIPTKTISSSLETVKKLLRTRKEDPVREGSRTPSISIGESGIPVAVLPKKIVLLGTSLSGKTTIYNHLQILYGKAFSKADHFNARQWIVNDLINAFQMAKEEMEFIQTDRGTEKNDAKHFRTLALATKTGGMNTLYALRCHEALRSLWRHPTLRSIILNGDHAAFNENIPYFMDHLGSLFTPEDLISHELLLRASAQTTTLDNVSLMINDIPCQVFDIGSSRLERNQWGHCIKDVDTLVFVVSLAGYSQPVDEDPKTNRMEESLTLFEQMTKLEELRKVPILLFLNKVDIFKQKMVDTPIGDSFPDYSGSLGYVTACNFFAAEFVKRDERPNGILKVYVTSAVEPKIFAEVLAEAKPFFVKDRSKLEELGKRRANTSIIGQRSPTSP